MVNIVQPTQEIVASSDGIKWAAYPDGDKPAGGVAKTLSALSFTPTHIVEANALSDGVNSPLLDDDTNTIASSAYTASDYGSKCFSMSIVGTATGFGSWGFVFNLPSNLGKGDSIQVQFSTLMPTAFDWTAPGEGGHLKFVRVHTQTSGGANEGYNDIYIDNETSSPGRDGKLKHITEISEPESWTELPEGLTKDVWETFELRVDLDNIPVDEAGTGRTILWQNQAGTMVKIMDLTTQKTLNTATSECDRVHLFTYWNGGSPQNNLCYTDRFIVETDLSKLVETDAGGLKIIGGLA